MIKRIQVWSLTMLVSLAATGCAEEQKASGSTKAEAATEPDAQPSAFESFRTHMNDGFEAWANGDVEEAFKEFGMAIHDRPGDAFAHYSRGQLAAAQGRWGSAIKDLTVALLELPEAFLDANTNVLGVLYLTRGYSAREMGHLQDALVDLKAAVDEMPRQPIAHNELGVLLDQLEDYHGAVESFGKACELAPSNGVYFFNRGTALSKAGQLEAAAADFSVAIPLRPDDMVARACRGMVYRELGRYSESVEDLTIAIQHGSNDAGVYLDRGIALSNLDRWEEAISDLAQAEQLGSRAVELFDNRAYAHSQLDAHLLAVDDYSVALRIDPTRSDIFMRRAAAHEQAGSSEKALNDYEQALLLDSDNPSVLNSLAWFLAVESPQSLRDPKRAIELATQACHYTDLREPNYLDTLAAAYASDGVFDEAVRWQKAAIGLMQPGEEAEEAKSRLLQYERNEKP